MQADVATEDPQQSFLRMSEFLCSILNYKLQQNQVQEFQNALTTGEKQQVYPILHWVLKRMPENRKRVYLSKYLVPVEVPEDMRASDDGVREVWEQYRGLVDQFKETHKNVDRLRNTADTTAFKNDISQFENEKEQLTARIQDTKKKLAKFSSWESLLRASQNLRKHADEQRVLQERVQEQHALLRQEESRLRMCNQRLAEVNKDFGEMDVNKIIKELEKEVKSNQLLVSDKLPKEMQEYQERVSQLARVINELGSADVLAEQVTSLEREIHDIEEKATPKLAPKEEESLGLFRKQAGLVTHRKEAKLLDLQALKDQKLAVDAQLKEKEVELEGFKDSKILKGDEFRAYATQLRGKSNNYKRLKAELQETKAELGILRRTEDLLMQQAESYDQSLTNLEKSRGIHGYRSTQEQMVQISETKALVDEQKTQTLEELSKVVQEFVANIRDRRNKLAPQILELRNTRQKSQAVEQEYQQKKDVYEGTQHELESEISKLQSEVDTLIEECHINESLYHRLNCQIQIAEVAQKRVEDEKNFKAGARKLNERYKSYTEMFDHTMAELESISKKLRDRQTDIEANHQSNLKQMVWFKNLKRLLDCKLSINKRENSEKVNVDMGLLTGATVGVNGVDRLVIEGAT
eukprot:TRINITY_DN59160_c0_g1_i1.p1 TRINITY_DN59160_c0_g1~~TRINITY_DN59160_c0_g1_i1.p1  ORF type:complete len:719 (-),score=92.71 TRINITY_DN59160_c0_g1_i1:1305-3215(-)